MPRMLVQNLGRFGVVKDIPAHALAPEVWSDANNVRFEEGGASTLLSQRTVLSAAGYNPLWLSAFPPTSNPIWVYANNANISCVQGGVHTLLRTGYTAAGARWHGFVFQTLGVFNQPNNRPQLWTSIDPATPLVDLTNWNTNDFGWDTRAHAIRPYGNFLIALRIRDGAGTTSYPFRVRWSDAAQPGSIPATWAQSASNFAGQQDFAETPGYVVDGLTLGDAFMVYKECCTWGLQVTGGGEVMRSWKVHDRVGILARDCVVSIPDAHVVCTGDDIIVHSGTPGSVRSILEDKLRDWLFSNLNPVAKDNCFMCLNVPRKEVWFYFPTGSATYANRALMWNWQKDRVGLRVVPETPFAALGPIFTSGTDTWTSGY